MPEGARLATGYLELTVSTRGAQRAIEGSIGQSGSLAGKLAGAGIGGGILSGVGAIARPIAGLIGGYFSAKAIGSIVGGGFSRALNIQDAEQKLKGLGNSASDVTQVMKDALSAVKGTAYGLDDAATLAATAVAAGVKPGQELSRYLKITADTAAAAGASLSDVGNVMNNVTTIGVAYNDSLQILAQKGIPIYSYLSKQLGVTTGDVKELASEGKISAEDLRKALEDNLGGAALATGETARGAFDNVLAAINRITAGFAAPIVAAAPGLFNNISGAIDNLGTVLAPVADQFGKFATDKINGLSDAIAGFDPSSLGGKLTGLKSTFQPFLDAIGQIGPVLAQVGPAFAPLGDAIVKLAPKLPPLIDGIAQLLPNLVELALIVVPLLVQVLPPLINLFGQVAPAISSILKVVGPAIGGLGELVGAMSGTVGPVTLATDTLKGKFGEVPAALTRGIQGGIGALQSFVGSVSQNVGAAVGVLAGFPGRVLGALGGLAGTLISAGENLMEGFIKGIQSAGKRIADAALAPVKAAVAGVKSFLGIASPSRLFMQIGGYTAEGMALGLEHGAGRIVDASSSLIPTVPSLAGLGSVSAVNSPAAAGFGTAGGGVNIGQIVAPDQDPVVAGRIMARQFQRVAAGVV